MDIKDYISSEILESYIVGTISEEDRQKIEHNLGRYPELRRELMRIEKIRQSRVMKPGDSSAANARITVTPTISLKSDPVARVRNLNPESSVLFWRIAAAAAVCLAIFACFFVVDFRSTLQETQAALREQLDRNQELATELSIVQNRLERTTGSVTLLDDPTYMRVVLSGTPSAPEARATVFWDPRSLQVYLSIQNLPPLKDDEQYQLWAISGSDALNAGVFRDRGEILRMSDVPSADAYAISLAPSGGNDSFDPSGALLVGEISR